jgi:SAM-dependent methyltransferase
MKCRHCQTELQHLMIDLGNAPPSNAYLTEDQLSQPEICYPLRVLVCDQCWLAQTEDFANRESLFGDDYAYFSGFSTSWLAHCERYVKEVAERFRLDETSMVVEVAANDGYLLQYVRNRGIPCLGIEPTASTAAAARAKGIEIVESFFGKSLAERMSAEGRQADLCIANNVLAHVPDINDFVSGFAKLLKPNGVATFEFPHLLRLIQGNQFDTIYHEHYSYLSLTAVEAVFRSGGLSVFDVEELSTHGGSLRVFAQRFETGRRHRHLRVDQLLRIEEGEGIRDLSFYQGLQKSADQAKEQFLDFLCEAKRRGKTVAAYGAAAKGNTLLNFANIGKCLIQFVVDKNPAKQGKCLPGSWIPIVAECRLKEAAPDYVVVFPWNLVDEVMEQLAYVRTWNSQFVTAIPGLRIR